MSFEDEWARLVADAEQRVTRVRLNGTGGGGGGTQGELHLTPALLRDRADKAVNKAAREFRDAHRDTVSKSSEVDGSLKGFACDGAFEDFAGSWDRGAVYVAGQIGEEGLAKALRSAADAFGYVDKEQARSLREARTTYKPGDVI
ncbi:hypothetical protein [Streptomyces ehimensis]|uniref:Uncharacterized protein n=1 Tax=Streptomyces ehimensis TaxID=68195 RepID=A0ABV9BUY6_9ACTN